jgi:copper ion binding protein
MTTTTLQVAGMTCAHCVASVSEELGKIAGVSDVRVELDAGGVTPVTVTSTGPLEREALAAAVDEAGYELVS